MVEISVSQTFSAVSIVHSLPLPFICIFIFFFVVVVVSAIVAITIGIRAGTVHNPLLGHNGDPTPLGLRVFRGVLTTRSQQQVCGL